MEKLQDSYTSTSIWPLSNMPVFKLTNCQVKQKTNSHKYVESMLGLLFKQKSKRNGTCFSSYMWQDFPFPKL